jgi:oligopeptide/dipeptide ABC transporter ATP-binding protein
VAGASLKVRRGTTLGLVGESGCGKSTIGRCILRLHDVDGGSILYRGEPVHDLSPGAFRTYRRHIQMVFQDPLTSFNPMLSVQRALMEALNLRVGLEGKERMEEVVRLLDEVGLGRRFVKRRPSEVSGGELQRVGIARCLAVRPSFIFLDEPTSALDMSIQGQIINLLLDLQQEEDLSYILVTHDLRIVKYMADDISVMYLGQIVEEGKKEDVFARPLHPYTQGLFAATLLGRREKRASRRRFQLRGEVLEVSEDFCGCRLYNRCRFAQEPCLVETQELVDVGSGHRVRCWRALEIEEQGG